MNRHESDSEGFARKNRERERERIQELSERPRGLGPGDIAQTLGFILGAILYF